MNDRPKASNWCWPGVLAFVILTARFSLEPLIEKSSLARGLVAAYPTLRISIDPLISIVVFPLLAVALYYLTLHLSWRRPYPKPRGPLSSIVCDWSLLTTLASAITRFGFGIAAVSWGIRSLLPAPLNPDNPNWLIFYLITGVTICAVGFTTTVRANHLRIDPFSAFHLTKAAAYISWMLAAMWMAATALAAHYAPRLHAIASPATAAAFVAVYVLVWIVVALLLAYLMKALSGDVRLAKTSRVLPLFVGVAGYLMAFTLLARAVGEWYGALSYGEGADVMRVAVFGWALSVVPLLFTLPGFVVAADDRVQERTAQRNRAGETRRRPTESQSSRMDGQTFTLASVEARVARAAMAQVRGHLALLTIVQHHLPVFIASLPVSMLLAIVVATRTAGEANSFLAPSLVGVTLAWLGPVLSGLYFIEDTYQRCYTRGLDRSLHRLRGHTVVVGFGDFARRFIREQLEKGVWSYETIDQHLQWSENILMPTGRFAKVLTYVVALDTEGELSATATTKADALTVTAADFTSYLRVPHAARTVSESASERSRPISIESLRDVGADTLARDPRFALELPVDVVIPVVLGDAISDEAHRLVRLADAGFVASLIPGDEGPEKSQGLLRSLERLAEIGRRIPLVLEIHSSRYLPYVVGRSLSDLPVHYIHSDHLEGLNAANVLLAAFEKERRYPRRSEVAHADSSRLPRVLICGTGRQTFYLLDAFFKSLDHLTYDQVADALAPASTSTANPAILLMGESTTYEPTEMPPSLSESLCDSEEWKRLMESWGLKLATHTRFIDRMPSPAPANCSLGKTISIPVLEREAIDHYPLKDVLEHFQPDIVMIAGYEPHVELKILQSLFGLLGRLGAWDALPLVLVGGRTGKRHLSRYLTDSLIFYSALWARDPGSSSSERFRHYPSPSIRRRLAGSSQPDPPFSGDMLVDVLQDPVERLTGLLRAYVDGELTDELPIQMDFCVGENTGIMGANLAALAGLTLTAVDPRWQRPIPTLLNARFILHDWRQIEPVGRRTVPFGIRAFARLVHPETLSLKPDCARVSLTYCGSRVRGELRESIGLALDEALRRTGATIPGRDITEASLEADHNSLLTQLESCCGMTTCPIEAFQKSIEASRWTVGHNDVQARDLQVVRTRQLSSRFRVGNHLQSSPDLTASSPAASIRVECTGGDRPGTFATAMNALVFRHLGVDENAIHRANLKYVSAYECHDKRYGVFTCYGTIGIEKARHPGTVIERIIVRPVTHWKEWHEYLADLKVFLNASKDSPGYDFDTKHERFELVLARPPGRR